MKRKNIKKKNGKKPTKEIIDHSQNVRVGRLMEYGRRGAGRCRAGSVWGREAEGVYLVVLVADNSDELQEPEQRRRGCALGAGLSDSPSGKRRMGARRPLTTSS